MVSHDVLIDMGRDIMEEDSPCVQNKRRVIKRINGFLDLDMEWLTTDLNVYAASCLVQQSMGRAEYMSDCRECLMNLVNLSVWPAFLNLLRVISE